MAVHSEPPFLDSVSLSIQNNLYRDRTINKSINIRQQNYNMTIEDEILQYLHYHPLSNRVEITLGITNPPSGRIVKRLLADAVTKGMIEVL